MSYSVQPALTSGDINKSKINNPLVTLAFFLGLLIYLIVRIVRTADFPIYFFCDEAFYGNQVESIFERWHRGEFYFPLFLDKASGRWVPQLAIYFYIIPQYIFGKSIETLRITSAVITIILPISLGMYAKEILKLRIWWLAPLLVSAIPTWLLHSRTAFDNVNVVVFFSMFLWGYGRYRSGKASYIVLAALAGAATAYSHLSGLILVGGAAILLFCIDFSYHMKRWRIVACGLVVLGITLIPLVNFLLTHPDAFEGQLVIIGSDLTKVGVSHWQKLYSELISYFRGIDPRYWFLASEQSDLIRHIWKGRPHIDIWLAPLTLIGLIISISRIREFGPRIILVALAVTPVPGVVAGLGIMRIFSIIIPISLFSLLGLEYLISIPKRIKYLEISLDLFLFISLGGRSVYMLGEALRDAPLWFSDYGMYGMQYGAKQLFVDSLPRFIHEHPEAQFAYSPTWANGADEFLSFFLSKEDRARFTGDSVYTFINSEKTIPSNLVFIVTYTELEMLRRNSKFENPQILLKVPFPDPIQGFFFVQLKYSEEAKKLFEVERDLRRKPKSGNFVLNGVAFSTLYSNSDMGELKDIFDGSLGTVLRGGEANPFVIDLTGDTEFVLRSLTLSMGGDYLNVIARIYDRQERLVEELSSSAHDKNKWAFNYKVNAEHEINGVSRIRLEVSDPRPGSDNHIHIWELLMEIKK